MENNEIDEVLKSEDAETDEIIETGNDDDANRIEVEPMEIDVGKAEYDGRGSDMSVTWPNPIDINVNVNYNSSDCNE